MIDVKLMFAGSVAIVCGVALAGAAVVLVDIRRWHGSIFHGAVIAVGVMVVIATWGGYVAVDSIHAFLDGRPQGSEYNPLYSLSGLIASLGLIHLGSLAWRRLRSQRTRTAQTDGASE